MTRTENKTGKERTMKTRCIICEAEGTLEFNFSNNTFCFCGKDHKKEFLNSLLTSIREQMIYEKCHKRIDPVYPTKNEVVLEDSFNLVSNEISAI